MANFFEFDPYASTTQSRDLRVIESTIDPQYKAKNDTLELNVDYNVTPALTFTSQTGYNHDFLWSTEDYNRFNTRPGAFTVDNGVDPVDGTVHNSTTPDPSGLGVCVGGEGSNCGGAGAYCDAGWVGILSMLRRLLRSTTRLQRPACRAGFE